MLAIVQSETWINNYLLQCQSYSLRRLEGNFNFSNAKISLISWVKCDDDLTAFAWLVVDKTKAPIDCPSFDFALAIARLCKLSLQNNKKWREINQL